MGQPLDKIYLKISLNALASHQALLINTKVKNYRKLYESVFGKIPVDKNGVSYEIHHIDGNHKNNEITNLKLVTIEEHFEIHYSQQNWAACNLILKRMKVTPKSEQYKHSELSRKTCQKMVEDGTHPFLGADIQRRSNLERVKNGTHNFLGGALQKEKSKNGTHNFFEINKRRREEGTNHLLKEVECPHCKKITNTGNFLRWHGDKCKLKPSN